jgi:hypothetical protein
MNRMFGRSAEANAAKVTNNRRKRKTLRCISINSPKQEAETQRK